MNVYEIFTRITMVNGVSSVLGAISKEVLSLEAGVGRLSKAFEGLNKTSLAVGGAIGVVGGGALIAGLAKITEHGTKLLDQQDKLQRSGIAYNDVLKLQADYYDRIGKAIPTSTASEYLKTVNELRSVAGSTAAATALAPRALMADALLSNTLGGDQSGAYYKLMRSAEMKGVSTDPAKLAQLTEQAFSYITAFGGKLTPQDFQTFARRGGTAWMNMKPEAFGPAAVAMADLGGSAAGTAMMTLQQLQQGTMTLSKQQAAALEKAGLLDMSKTTKTGFGGGRLQLAPGAILGSLQYAGDLPGWVKDVVYPHMMGAAGGDEAQFQNMLGKEAPNRNAAKMIEMFGNKGFRDQISKDLGLAGQVKPIEQAYGDFTSRNPAGVKQAFSAQYESMMQAIGAPLMQAAIPIMKSVTDMFAKIGDFANAHPETIKIVGEGLAALAVGLAALGSAAILAALAAMGGGAGLIAGLAAGCAALAAIEWNNMTKGVDVIRKGIDSVTSAVEGFGVKLMETGKKIWDFVSTLGGLLNKTSFGGGFGGGGSIINASLGSSAGALSAGERGMYASMIKQYGGDEAANLLKIYGTEGAGGYVGDSGSSFGPFQSHIGGLAGGANSGRGIGDQMLAAGIDPRDKSTVRQQIEFMREYGHKHGGYSENIWHGLKGHGGSLRSGHGGDGDEQHIHIHIDGKQIHDVVLKRAIRGMEHPVSAAYHDGSRSWTPPDAGLVGV